MAVLGSTTQIVSCDVSFGKEKISYWKNISIECDPILTEKLKLFGKTSSPFVKIYDYINHFVLFV